MLQPSTPSSRRTLGLLLVLLGLPLLLLLNGQVFSNTVGFLVCLTLSALLWLPIGTSLTRADRMFHGCVFALHLVAIGAVLMSLPAAYDYQQKFNDVRKLHRQRPTDAADAPRGASAPP